MSREVDREHFEPADYTAFAARLRAELEALDALLARPGFGTGEPTIGIELELSLIDAGGRPLPHNHAVLARAVDPHLTLEVDRFNLEYNSPPVPLAGRPFAALGTYIDGALAEVNRAAGTLGGRVVAIGILPTLRAADLESWVLSDMRRYRALSAAVRRLRHAPHRVMIDGAEPLEVTCDDVTLEGANTSLQLHLRVEPSWFARTYNAAQLAVAPVLAAAVNSPLFLGHLLWDETRVTLFRQAVDERAADEEWRPGRVSFGHGWARRGAHELFAESVALHAPLLPLPCDDPDPLACALAGTVPPLASLRLHQGTVWTWNRPVYDPAGDGHLRIELRVLPSGPSRIDMLANSAFLLGLTLGLAPDADRLVTALPFSHARTNFYRAARAGLDARLYWPCDDPPSPRSVRARDLISHVLPIARRGLLDAGVDRQEVDPLLGVIEGRVASGMTGARWQRRTLAELERRLGRPEALVAMLERYVHAAALGSPVHCWPVDG